MDKETQEETIFDVYIMETQAELIDYLTVKADSKEAAEEKVTKYMNLRYKSELEDSGVGKINVKQVGITFLKNASIDLL